jgi:hypothetical protein
MFISVYRTEISFLPQPVSLSSMLVIRDLGGLWEKYLRLCCIKRPEMVRGLIVLPSRIYHQGLKGFALMSCNIKEEKNSP